MKKPFILISVFTVGFIVGALVVYALMSVSVGKLTQSMAEASDGSQEFYLASRFSGAYGNQPVNVAIWEGTNFETFLNKNWTPPLSVDQRASLCMLHARLSALFKEAGLQPEASAEADQTLKWVQTITNMLVTPSDAVSNILKHSDIKRQVLDQRTTSHG